MKHWHYAHSGLHITSDLEVPEWAAFERSAEAETDVTIRRHPTSTGAPLPIITAEEYTFHVAEAGTYRVQACGEIEIWPDPGADPAHVRVFLLGSAWGSFCHLRGLLTLHASVAEVANAAIAFCGESGAGKSTLAAWMSARGHAIVSDDLCRVEVASEEGTPWVYRSAGRVKLWQDALANLGWDKSGLSRDHARMEKFHVPLSDRTRRDRLPLTAIYLPVWGEMGLSRLSGLAALRRLIGAATYRGELLEPMGRLAGHWRLCAELLTRVPVWELSRPRDPARLAESVALVVAHAARLNETRQGSSDGPRNSRTAQAGPGIQPPGRVPPGD